MTRLASGHWASIEEQTCVGGIHFMWGVHRLFGRLPFRCLLYPVVFWYWAVSGDARRASMQYLQRLHLAKGVPARAPDWRDSLRHFMSFADTLLDKLLASSGRYRFDRVDIEGDSLLAAQLASGRGALIVTAHVGCLELCRALAARSVRPLKLTVLVHTAHAQRFNRLLQRLDPHSEVRLLQVSEVDAGTAVMLEQCIDRGELVAIVGDRVPVQSEGSSGKTIALPFLGAEARFPVGAYVLASLLQCPLFFMGCVRRPGGHLVRFERLAERLVLPRARREEALRVIAGAYVERLEALVVQSPYDWFNFFPFWNTHP